MRAISTLRLPSILLVGLLFGIGFLGSGCDSGGSNSGDPGGGGVPDNTTGTVSDVGGAASVTLGRSKTKATQGQAGGVLIVDFFYDNGGGTCRATARASVGRIPTTKTLSPDPADCGSDPTRVGVSISFVSLTSTSGDFTLELHDSEGNSLASTSSSDGQLTVADGNVPVTSDNGGENRPAWTGTWEVMKFDGNAFQGAEAYRITETRWSGVFQQQDGTCFPYSGPIINRDGNQITTFRSDGLTPTYRMSVSDETLTATVVDVGGEGSLRDITATAIETSPLASVDCTIDTNAPNAPSGLNTTVSEGKVALSWNAVQSDDLTKYNVYRSTASMEAVTGRGPIAVVGTDGAPTYTDTGLEQDPTYYYRVAAVDENGNVSAPSAESEATLSGDGNEGDANTPPTATLNAPSSGTVGQSVLLDGSGSSDPDGDNLTYTWSLQPPSESTASLSSRSAVQPTFTPDVAGTYEVTLTVSDGSASDTKTATVNVNPSDDGSPPEWTGTWKVTSSTRFDTDNLYYAISTENLRVVNGATCTTSPSYTVSSISGNTATLNGAFPEVMFDLSNGGDQLTMRWSQPPQGVFQTDTATPATLPDCSNVNFP